MSQSKPDSIIVSFDALRTLAFGSISSSYAAIGTPYIMMARTIKIVNTMDTDATISFDGVTDNDYIPAGGFVLYDFCSNRSEQGGYFIQPVGTQVYAATPGSPSKGAVIVTVLYAF